MSTKVPWAFQVYRGKDTPSPRQGLEKWGSLLGRLVVLHNERLRYTYRFLKSRLSTQPVVYKAPPFFSSPNWSPAQLRLRLVRRLLKILTQRFEVLVLADTRCGFKRQYYDLVGSSPLAS